MACESRAEGRWVYIAKQRENEFRFSGINRATKLAF